MSVLWARCMLAACTHHSIICRHTTWQCVPYCSRVAPVECITPAEPTAHRSGPAPGRPSPPSHCTCQSCAEARPHCACRCSLASAISHAPPARPPPSHQRVQHCHAPLSRPTAAARLKPNHSRCPPTAAAPPPPPPTCVTVASVQGCRRVRVAGACSGGPWRGCGPCGAKEGA